MIYTLRTINGETYDIDSKTKQALEKIILTEKRERPAFIRLAACDSIIATSSIVSIRPVGKKPERLPTPEEELEEFNRTWTP